MVQPEVELEEGGGRGGGGSRRGGARRECHRHWRGGVDERMRELAVKVMVVMWDGVGWLGILD